MKRVAPRSSRPRRWFHGLFSCCEDVPLSCQVFFCECNAIGQMYERTAKRGGACLAIASILWITFFVSQFLSDTSVALATSAVREVCVWWGVCTTVVDQGQLTAFPDCRRSGRLRGNRIFRHLGVYHPSAYENATTYPAEL